MAETYWISYKIENDYSHDKRHAALMGTLRDCSLAWWVETTSFVVFSSDLAIDSLAVLVIASINTKQDVALIGMSDFQSTRLVGASRDAEIFQLMPSTKKL